MLMHVYGIVPPDEKWKKMKAVWDACEAAGTDPPDDVEKFFNGESPDEMGVLISLDSYKKFHPSLKEYSAEMQNGYEVDLTKLPPEVKIIRFVNSY